MLRRIGTRSGGKRHRYNSSGSTKHGKARLTNKHADKEQELSTFYFDEYWRQMWEKIPSQRTSGCVFFDPLCFGRYLKDRSDINLKKWVYKKEVLSSRYVFVPMCQSKHWNLLIICNIGEDFQSTTKSPCLLLLDSLQAAGSKRLEPQLRRFLFDIYKYAKREESCEEIFNIRFEVPKIPQQLDGSKCGYYVLQYMLKFLMDCPDHFDISKDYPGFMNEKWFSIEDLESFCDKLTSGVALDKEFGQATVEEFKKVNDGGEGRDAEKDIGTSSPNENALFEGSDALRALVIYTPDSSQQHSSQEKCETVLPSNKKESMSSINEPTVKAPTKLRVKVKAIRSSPRLTTAKPEINDPATKVSVHEPQMSEVSKIKKRKKQDQKRVNKKKGKKRVETEREDAGDDPEIIEIVEIMEETEAEKKIGKKRKGKFPNLVETERVDKKQRKKRKTGAEKEETEEEIEEMVQPPRNLEMQMPTKVLLRAYPSTFTRAIEQLTEKQKEWVTRAGFGPLLSFQMWNVPQSMAVNVIWWFDHLEDQMCLHNQKIKITEQDIADILGLPKGQREICFEKSKVDKDNKAKFENWRSQFPDKEGNKITELTVFEAIRRSKVVDLHFKQNFMILMMNLFISTNTSSFLCQDVLGFTGDFDDAEEYNWCKLVLEGLHSAHELWWEDPQKKYYTGSLVFLLFFYLDRTMHTECKAERTRPPFIGWRDSLIGNRNRSELVDGTFGKGKIVGRFETEKRAEEEHNEQPASIPDMSEKSTARDTMESAGVQTVPGSDGLLPECDNLRTPKETIRGVQSPLMFSQEDQINSGIISVARDINNMYNIATEEVMFERDSNDIVTEEGMMSQVCNEINEFKAMHERCEKSLRKATELFPDNSKLKELKDTFANIKQPSSAAETGKERCARESPKKAGNEEKYILGRPKRDLRVGESNKSPYLDRTINLDRKMTKAEEEVWNWIQRDASNPMQQIFFWEDIVCMKHQLQTLKCNERISSAIVDVYASILNEDEKYRSPESPNRFFCSSFTTMTSLTRTSQIETETAEEAEVKFSRFKSRLNAWLAKHNCKINNIDLIFFPVKDKEHFYIVCFNLRNPSIEILDNNKLGDYDGFPESLQAHFVSYMEKISPIKSKQLSSLPIVPLELKWSTVHNKVDSGIFAINHMETYKGYGLRNWDCKFGCENGIQQKKQLEKARQIYASKIIYSPLNLLKNKMLKEIKSHSQCLNSELSNVI